MPIEKRRLQGLFTLTDVAHDTGLTESTFWRLVYQDGLIPRPATTLGRRMFYSEAELVGVRKAVERLMARGRNQ